MAEAAERGGDWFRRYYLDVIGKTRLLTREEEIVLSQKIQRYWNKFVRTALRTEFGVRGFYDYFNEQLDDYQRKLKEKRIRKDLKTLESYTRSRVIRLGDVIGSGLDNSENLEKAANIIRRMMKFKIKKSEEEGAEEEVLGKIRETYEVESIRLFDCFGRLDSTENAKAKERLEQRIFVLDEENKRKYGEDWGYTNYLMQTYYYKYKRAERTFAKANLRLVASIAKEYLYRNLDINELVQEGYFGLIKAIKRWDNTRGLKFSTYGTWWIKQAMGRALKEKPKVVRIPSYLQDLSNAIRKTRLTLMNEKGREVYDYEVAERLEMDSLEVTRIRVGAAKDSGSLDGFFERYDKSSLQDRGFEDKKNLPTDEMTGQVLLKERIKGALDKLNPREREILKLRYGLFENEENTHTLEEIGPKFRITRERVRQIQNESELKLWQILTGVDVMSLVKKGVNFRNDKIMKKIRGAYLAATPKIRKMIRKEVKEECEFSVTNLSLYEELVKLG